MTQSLLSHVDQGVGVITINRPGRLNAMDNETGENFEKTLAAMALDGQVKSIVITGAGGAFCAGADTDRLATISGEARPGSKLRRPGDPSPFDDVPGSPASARGRYTCPMATPKPVIAAIDGACAGAGLSLAVACDVRFASRRAVFTAAFPKRGLVAEQGIAWMLLRLVGRGAASDILLSGRKVGAEEALRMGLVNSIVESEDLMEAAVTYARDLATSVSPRSARVIKMQLFAAAEQSHAEAVRLAFDETMASLDTEDFREGLASFRERRAPVFTGR